MMTPDALKAEIERFLTLTGMSATTFGISALNDPRFVFDLRNDDREPRRRTMQRAVDFMACHAAAKTQGRAA